MSNHSRLLEAVSERLVGPLVVGEADSCASFAEAAVAVCVTAASIRGFDCCPRRSLSTRDSGSLSPRTVVLASEALLTLVALGVGVGYTVERSLAAERAEEARSDLDRRTDSEANVCRNPTAEFASSCARLEEANQDGIDASHLATLGFVGAGIAAAATVATWYLWRPEEPRHALGIHAAPVAGRGMLGGLSGSF